MFRLILLTAREVERTRRLALAAELLRLLDGAAGRLAAALRSVRFLRHALWFEAGFLRCSSTRALLRELPALRNEAAARRGEEPCRALCRRAVGSHRIREVGANPSARELREAGLSWIEHHLERRLKTRETFGEHLKTKVKA